jgi:hypothetical protein
MASRVLPADFRRYSESLFLADRQSELLLKVQSASSPTAKRYHALLPDQEVR